MLGRTSSRRRPDLSVDQVKLAGWEGDTALGRSGERLLTDEGARRGKAADGVDAD